VLPMSPNARHPCLRSKHPQGEREPEVASAKRVIANSTVSGQNLVGSHGGRRHPHDQGNAWSSVRDVEREWESLP